MTTRAAVSHRPSDAQATYRPGKQFLQLPGPTNIPDRILNAMRVPAVDQRGKDFANVALECMDRVKGLFGTSQPVLIYPGTGTGAWESAMQNVLAPGDKVLMHETGHFAMLWHKMAKDLGLEPIYLTQEDWRRGLDPDVVEDQLKRDTKGEIKAVLAVHNETSNAVTCRLPEIRQAIDNAGHDALLMVDAISSLGCTEYEHDAWGIDVTICGSQKGMMLPAGLGFNAVSQKALEISKKNGSHRCYFDWAWMMENNPKGFFPYTPPVQLFYGLRESLDMFAEEGLANVIARHKRFGRATRACCDHWGLELVAEDPREYSDSLTAVFVPSGYSSDELRSHVLENFNVALGGGLTKLAGRAFRIGHMGDLHGGQLIGTLGAVEMGLSLAGIPHNAGGVQAAMAELTRSDQGQRQQAAAATA